MKNVIVLSVAILLFLSSCRSKTPVIETDYKAQSLDVQLNNLTNQMVKSLTQEKKSKIAIMEFPDLHGTISEFGKFIPEELTTRLFMTRRFEVLERQLLNKVLEEQNLGMSGLIDASSAAQIGKLLGVDAIVTGTITDMGTMIRINARMIATETAGVFAVASVSIDKEPHIVAMMNRLSANAETLPVGDSRPTEVDNPVSPPPPGPQRTAAITKTTVEDFEFEIISTALTTDNRAIIELMITNKTNRDKELGLLSTTRFFDNFGYEYGTPVRSLGTKRTTSRYATLNHLFIINLPTRVRLEFSDIDPDTESAALLIISVNGLENEVQLRNFKLNR